MNCCLLCLTTEHADVCCVTASSRGVTPFNKGVNYTEYLWVGTLLLVETEFLPRVRIYKVVFSVLRRCI